MRLWTFEDCGEDGEDEDEGVACVGEALDFPFDCDCGGGGIGAVGRSDC